MIASRRTIVVTIMGTARATIALSRLTMATWATIATSRLMTTRATIAPTGLMGTAITVAVSTAGALRATGTATWLRPLRTTCTRLMRILWSTGTTGMARSGPLRTLLTTLSSTWPLGTSRILAGGLLPSIPCCGGLISRGARSWLRGRSGRSRRHDLLVIRYGTARWTRQRPSRRCHRPLSPG